MQCARALALLWVRYVRLGAVMCGKEEESISYLCAPEAEHDRAAGAVAYFLGEQAGIRVVLEGLGSVLCGPLT